MRPRRLTAREVLLEDPSGTELPRPARIGDIDDAERTFFKNIRVKNGSNKTTHGLRLDDLNELFADVLVRSHAKPRDFLDVAASSGITTVEWRDSLRRVGVSPVMVGSDLTITAFLVFPFPAFRVLVDASNFPLQFDIAGFAVNAWIKNRDWLTGQVLLTVAARAAYRALSFALAIDGKLKGDGIEGQRAHDFVRRVRLISRRAAECRDIAFIDDDISRNNPPELVAKFDVIRAANVLNRVYFSDRILRTMVFNLAERLKGEGSWLIVCRTLADGSNHGSVFRLDDGRRFSVAARIGKGSEIEDLVLAAGRR